MASSRTLRRKADPDEVALLEALRRAVEEAGAEPAPPARGRARSAPLLLAFSGGRDSTVLVDLAARLRAARNKGFADLLAVHVHHGLAAQADAWVEHCESFCRDRDITLDVRQITVERRGRGVEAAARDARYGALAAAAREHGARCVLTAHHLDDRVETFLIQWMRGAGVDGLASFPTQRPFGNDDLQLVRPFVDVPRAQIDRYVELRGLAFVEDPSNSDTRLLRNALRARVVPELEAARAGFRKAAARSIDLVAEAALALREVAAQDLAACTEDAPTGMLWLERLAQLSPERRALALRAWLAAAGVEPPSRARLTEIIRQALSARGDARLLLRVGSRELRRHRGLLLLRAADDAARAGATIQWHGEPEIAVPSWSGVLRFVPTEGEGFERAWLRAHPLELRARTGGERFKPHPTRPSKTLKRLFQDAGIAEFDRGAMPLVWRDDELIYVAGLGADVRLTDADGDRIALEWLPDATLLDIKR
jgi:tRNA(Ile)-lysidine synthase